MFSIFVGKLYLVHQGRAYFASITQPGIQSVDTPARWPANPTRRLFSANTPIKVYHNYHRRKLNAPRPDTKTPENQLVEKIGEHIPPTKAMVQF